MSSLPGANPEKKPTSRMIVPIVAIMIVGLIAGVSSLSYIQSNNAITSYKQDIATQSSSIGSLNAQVSSQGSEISSQNSEINSQSSVISSQGSVASSQSSEISVQSSTISSLTGQVSALKSINNLTISQNEVISQTYRTGSGGNATVDSFSVDYAGYVLVSMSSASDYANEGLTFVNAFSSSVNSPQYRAIAMPALGLFYPFSGATDSYVFPVVPGTATVYLLTADNSSQSATLSVTYYY